ncbi:hypothetical protein [Nannocystis sp. SCPEA4]|uniref:hypothetical protein n=1 Tax=Nannocystis sp. SCPEA4 TaxID=2996787 RepID=UPI00226DD89C|nr:hypothetical protein [Nannocystis sp. SCPEA4]MCY1059565.1 hypothetical protein [Nannocystis sp. SCPEA4]
MNTLVTLALALFALPACDAGDVQLDGRASIAEKLEVGNQPAQDKLNPDGEFYPWEPGEREAAVAEAAEYNALFPEGLDLSESFPGDDDREFDQLSLASGEDDSVERAICPLELVEPCIDSWAICAVRCCDGALFKTAQACGNCGAWSIGACAAHDTRRRVRWEWP